ncbi:MAG: histidine phosphatase family protein [Planctomycetota bacterium]
MKSLYVLRHGKSDWGTSARSDFERPLAARGVASAGLVGRFLASIGEVPSIVVASAAVRAAETARIAIAEGGWSTDLVHEPDLYGASAEQMLRAARSAPASAERVLVVAHEPGCSELVGRMVGGCALRYPTAALARIDCAAEAPCELAFGAGTLEWLVLPRALAAFEASARGTA